MEQAHETIVDGAEIPFENGKIKVRVDHLLDMKDDEDGGYTGCYRATLANGQVLNVELNSQEYGLKPEWIHLNYQEKLES